MLAVKILALYLAEFILVTNIHYIGRIRKDGLGYAGKAYRESRLIEKIKALPPEISIYSNLDLPISLYTGRSPAFLPVKIDNQTQQPNKNYEKEMKQMVDELQEGGGVIVYFNRDDHWYVLPELEEINQRMPLRCVDTESDGAIYEAREDTVENENEK